MLIQEQMREVSRQWTVGDFVKHNNDMKGNQGARNKEQSKADHMYVKVFLIKKTIQA